MLEKKSFTFFLALTAFILIIGFLISSGALGSKTKEVKPPTKDKGYTCPKSGWVDCMPVVDKIKAAECTPEAFAWYKANCPNFKGGAY